MVISIRKGLKLFKYILLFLLCTYVVFRIMLALTQWIEPRDHYRKPAGQALKVFQETVNPEYSMTINERLRLFYWYGE